MAWLGETGVFKSKTDEFRLDIDDPSCSSSLALLIRRLSGTLLTGKQDLIVLCIGTDRSTGDALGPLTGSRLRELKLSGVHVYGTLEKPVHATNLHETIQEIGARHINPLIIAVDACLGRVDSVGNIMVGRGPLKPGAGVNKDLPAVGDLYITGIVNVGGFMDYFVLQNTRLHLIVRLASAIAEGIYNGLASLTAFSQTTSVWDN